MKESLRVLIVDDSDDDAQLLARHLSRSGFEPQVMRASTEEGLRALMADKTPIDIVLCDYSMGPWQGPDAFRVFCEYERDVPFIVVSGAVGEETAVECMLLGVHDFILKDRLARLVPAVRRELAEAKRRAEQAELERRVEASRVSLAHAERLRSIGQMAAGVSHDLKNLLYPMKLQLDLLGRAIGRNDLAEAEESVGQMREVVARGVETIERLTALGRKDVGGLPAPVDLVAKTHDAVEVVRARLRGYSARRIRLEEQHARESLIIRGHAGEILAAVVNLLINALDVIPETGGQVVLSTSEEDGAAMVRVTDTGPGMTEDVRASAFDPFFTTKGTSGTGLGLAMVASCMENHGGTAAIVSAPGEGCTVSLRFPKRAS